MHEAIMMNAFIFNTINWITQDTQSIAYIFDKKWAKTYK